VIAEVVENKEEVEKEEVPALPVEAPPAVPADTSAEEDSKKDVSVSEVIEKMEDLKVEETTPVPSEKEEDAKATEEVKDSSAEKPTEVTPVVSEE